MSERCSIAQLRLSRTLPFGDGLGGELQYTLGMCFNLSGQWFCSAAIQFWFGRDLDASGPARYVAQD